VHTNQTLSIQIRLPTCNSFITAHAQCASRHTKINVLNQKLTRENYRAKLLFSFRNAKYQILFVSIGKTLIFQQTMSRNACREILRHNRWQRPTVYQTVY